MPFIDWARLPKAVRYHLSERVKERAISEDDLVRLAAWIKTNQEVPEALWCKDFGSFVLAGEGSIPKTILMKVSHAKGSRSDNVSHQHMGAPGSGFEGISAPLLLQLRGPNTSRVASQRQDHLVRTDGQDKARFR